MHESFVVSEEIDGRDGSFRARAMMIQTLRRRREALGITQKELAERVGIAQSNLSHYEGGRFYPTLGNAARIARALGLRLVLRLEPLPAAGEEVAA